LSQLSSYPIRLDGNDVAQKRQEIREYFINTFEMYEKIFEILKDESVFYKKSEPTRHPMIFYYGHTATFYVNKLIQMKIIQERINPDLESIFAVGVDEMTWDDVDESNYEWPRVEETREYRQKVKNLVLELIDSLPFTLPITWESQMWIVLMGIEHERIHLETSSVLHRQMPLDFIKDTGVFDTCKSDSKNIIKNELVKIEGSEVILGKTLDDSYYGWDNEYGIYKESVEAFECSKYLVSNEEFLEFVDAGGYEKKEYWSEEGRAFLEKSNAKYPVFWVQKDKEFEYRSLTSQIKMPKNFPVDVNSLEAEAFCRYKSLKDGIEYSLPSEAEYEAICKDVGIDKIVNYGEANLNFLHGSSTPIDMYKFGKLYDVVGNVWQHSRTPIRAFEGFKVHPAYDDFTVPTFDEKHNLILGSSWASSGNLIMKKSRYAFRRHFYQHAGFRYVVSKQKDNDVKDIYETDALVSQYCEFQYGKSHFGVKNFAVECARIASSFANKKTKALDLGCATGRASFELAKEFDQVEGIDFSARFVQVGTKLKEEGYIAFQSPGEGDLVYDTKVTLEDLEYENLKDKISFWQGDACNLKPNFESYDLVMATNLIDRLYNPELFLKSIGSRLNDNGILVLTSPYTWQESSTKKEFWLGGFKDENDNEVKTLETLEKILDEEFTLVSKQDVEFVIQETARKFQHTIAELTVWKKR